MKILALALALSTGFVFQPMLGALSAPLDQSPMARGIVFDDANRNGRLDSGERGIQGVRVSNQEIFATTDRDGRWSLPHDDDTTFFVVKPRGWMTPLNKEKLPQFYYTHKPEGSPELRFGGVKPTGPLPESIHFPLHRQKEPDEFKAIFFGDTQSRNLKEIDYLVQGLITKMSTDGAMFGVTLGDILFDNLAIFQEHNEAVALLGIPWYNVLGNHDINFDATSDELSDETFERYYGPNYYSFEYGKAHFVVLDNVDWQHGSTREDGRGRYVSALGEKQFAWLRENLRQVPKDRLVVLMMHIPIQQTKEKVEIMRMLSERPYTLSVSAHTHTHEHQFLGPEHGHAGPKPHHHVINVTACGSWWRGAPDQFGIPHSTMRDGAPRGYSIFSFDGNQYTIQFRAANRPASYQMEIHAPGEIASSEAVGIEILANVFAGSSKNKVELKVGEKGTWVPMTKVDRPDPAYQAMVARDQALERPYMPLPAAENSTHLWSGRLPAGIAPGYHPIHVRSTDMFGQVTMGSRGILVR